MAIFLAEGTNQAVGDQVNCNMRRAEHKPRTSGQRLLWRGVSSLMLLLFIHMRQIILGDVSGELETNFAVPNLKY